MPDKKVLVGVYDGSGRGSHTTWVTGDTLVDPDGNPIGGGGGNTLGGAYNQGGVGAGRTIAVASGLPVLLNGAGTEALRIDDGLKLEFGDPIVGAEVHYTTGTFFMKTTDGNFIPMVVSTGSRIAGTADITIRTGDATSGVVGDVVLKTGATSGGTRGVVHVEGTRLEIDAHTHNGGMRIPTYTTPGSPSVVTGTSDGDVVVNTGDDTLYFRSSGAWWSAGGGGGGVSDLQGAYTGGNSMTLTNATTPVVVTYTGANAPGFRCANSGGGDEIRSEWGATFTDQEHGYVVWDQTFNGLHVKTSDSAANQSREIRLETGLPAAGQHSGTLQLLTGDTSGAGISGDIALTAGTAASAVNRGTIKLNGANIELTPADVGVGVGVTAGVLVEKLEVDGAIKLGDATTPASTANGTIRWSGADLEGRKGAAWVSLTAGAGGGVSDLQGAYSGGNAVVLANDTTPIYLTANPIYHPAPGVRFGTGVVAQWGEALVDYAAGFYGEVKWDSISSEMIIQSGDTNTSSSKTVTVQSGAPAAGSASGEAHVYTNPVSGAGASGMIELLTGSAASSLLQGKIRLCSSDIELDPQNKGVGIGVFSPSINEKLEVAGAIVLGNAAAPASTANGTIRYSGSDLEGRIGGSWVSLSAGAGGGVSLDQAYNFGGPGSGRTITVNSGALQLNGIGPMLEVQTGGIAYFGAAATVRGALQYTSGVFYIETDTGGTTSSPIEVRTGGGGAASGTVKVQSGPATGSSGDVSILSGDVGSGTSGLLVLKTGNATSGASGTVKVQAGTGSSASGGIELYVGGSGVSAARGDILERGRAHVVAPELTTTAGGFHLFRDATPTNPTFSYSITAPELLNVGGAIQLDNVAPTQVATPQLGTLSFSTVGGGGTPDFWAYQNGTWKSMTSGVTNLQGAYDGAPGILIGGGGPVSITTSSGESALQLIGAAGSVTGLDVSSNYTTGFSCNSNMFLGPNLTMAFGSATTGASIGYSVGDLRIIGLSDGANSSLISLETASTSINSGSIVLTTGNGNNNTGQITLVTGDSSANFCGDINLWAGGVAHSNKGDINLRGDQVNLIAEVEVVLDAYSSVANGGRITLGPDSENRRIAWGANVPAGAGHGNGTLAIVNGTQTTTCMWLNTNTAAAPSWWSFVHRVSNSGAFAQVLKNPVTGHLEGRTIQGGTGITVNQNADDIEIVNDNPTPYLPPAPVCGEMYITSGGPTLGLTTSWQQVTGMVGGVTSGVNFGSNVLEVSENGIYEINISLSGYYAGGNADNFEITIAINGTPYRPSSAEHTTSTPTIAKCVATPMLASLSAGQIVELLIRSATTTVTLSVQEADVMIHMIR